jgi:hypothetical protein
MEKRNAIITNAKIEIEDHGFLSARISLDYGDGNYQGFGSYALYAPKNGLSERNYAGHFIYRVLEVAGVCKWEQLQGRAVRVESDLTHIAAIGHVVENIWFYPGEEFKQLKSDVSA